MKLRRGTRRRGAIVLLCVIALHVALGWLLLDAIAAHVARQSPPLQRVTMRLIPETVTPPRRAAEPSPSPPATAAARVRAQPAARTPSPAAQPALDRMEPAPELASHAEPAASAPLAMPSLMDTEATRRAIRDSARQPAQIGHVAGAGDEARRASTQERLAADVKAAGKGDCVKGEYLGAGMGLLSVPFLAVAALRGACAQ